MFTELSFEPSPLDLESDTSSIASQSQFILHGNEFCIVQNKRI